MTKQLNGKKVATLRYWWDSQDEDSAGWYVEALDSNGGFLNDSVKIWFPVEVNDFDHDSEAELIEALKEEFPAASIEAATN